MMYTLNHTGKYERNMDLRAARAATAPGMVWLERSDSNELLPDFLVGDSIIAGHWRREDVELYGVPFEDFELFVNSLGYKVVYNH